MPACSPVAPIALDQIFDTVILGGGFIGYAAADRLIQRGERVLLIEPTGQLLWESSRALEHNVGADAGEEARTAAEYSAWSAWRDALERNGAARGGLFDPVFAEIAVSRRLHDARERAAVLFYAFPVAAELADGALASLTLATKSGLRAVRARHWIDASEAGRLATLVSPGLAEARRAPTGASLSLMLRSTDWPRHEPALSRFCEEAGARLERALHPDARRLCWTPAAAMPWHEAIIDLLRRFRAAAPLAGSELVVTHCAAEAYPVYHDNADAPPSPPPPSHATNLTVLSPALRADRVVTVAERYLLGANAARELPQAVGVSDEAVETPVAPAVVETLVCDVLVAGTGTAGAIAAVAAARAGSAVRALDFASFPGGVGTGGGINGYFYGAEGGLQAEIDGVTAEMDRLLEGGGETAGRWHHEGKKLALLSCFARHGVVFHGDTLLCDVEKDGRGVVRAVLAATERGFVRFEARGFVDSTGDGDLCVRAGAEFETGREGDGRTLAYSQSAFMTARSGNSLFVTACNFDSGWTDPTDCEDLSRARLLGVAQHWRARWDDPDRPCAIAPLPGIRQSRRIVTDHTLSFRDVVDGGVFADSIGEAASIADTHSVDYEFEHDEAVFFFWVCRLFRHRLRTGLPYRMLLPRGLANVWIACRAAGIDSTAIYAVRMQRDMQRLGEAAGLAAARPEVAEGGSRAVDVSALREGLGGGAPTAVDAVIAEPDAEEAEEAFLRSAPGLHLWRIYRRPARHREWLRRHLLGADDTRSFYAACIFAMWGEAEAEPRLLFALERREEGPPPARDNTGAHGQEIDIPFWLLGLILLRRCGTTRCLDALAGLARRPDNLLNVRTALALTVERLAGDGRITREEAAGIADDLLRSPVPDALLAPSHSIWRRLRGEAQLRLRNDRGAETRQDNSWQLHLVVNRIRQAAGFQPHEEASVFARDARAVVRHAFARFVPQAVEGRVSVSV